MINDSGSCPAPSFEGIVEFEDEEDERCASEGLPFSDFEFSTLSLPTCTILKWHERKKSP